MISGPGSCTRNVATPSGRGNTARIEIAFARSQAGLVYASVDNARGEVWRSLDSGATWTKLAAPEHLGVEGHLEPGQGLERPHPDLQIAAQAKEKRRQRPRLTLSQLRKELQDPLLPL